VLKYLNLPKREMSFTRAAGKRVTQREEEIPFCRHGAFGKSSGSIDHLWTDCCGILEVEPGIERDRPPRGAVSGLSVKPKIGVRGGIEIQQKKGQKTHRAGKKKHDQTLKRNTDVAGMMVSDRGKGNE